MAWTAEQMAQKRAKLQKKTNAAAGGAEPLSQRKSADSPPDSGALGSTGNSVSDNKSNTWTAEKMAEKRAALQTQKRAKLQKKTNAAAGGAEPLSQRKSADSPPDSGALGSTGNSVSDNKSNTWTAEKMAEKRAALQTQKQQTGTDLYSTALEDYRTRNNLGFADAMDSRSDELNRQKVTVSPAEKMEQNASTVQKLREQRNNGIRMDVYSTVNNWKDASERNRELARLVTDPTLPRGAVSAADLPAGVDYLAADTGGIDVYKRQVQTKIDVSHMSRKEMEEMEKRVMRGEVITL